MNIQTPARAINTLDSALQAIVFTKSPMAGCIKNIFKVNYA